MNAATTIADIAPAAEVPVGNVYSYFKTKDELVQAALTEHTTTWPSSPRASTSSPTLSTASRA